MNFKLLAVAAACACAMPAFAGDYQLGAGLHFDRQEYKGMDIEPVPFPIMHAETEHFYLHGLEAGGYLLKTPSHQVTLGISYMPLSFDASESDNTKMKKLDDRDASAFANLGYRFNCDWFSVGAKISTDISGKSEGMLADVNILKRFTVQGFGITPMVGVTWASANFNDYYYGVSRAESARSKLRAYSPDADTSAYARVLADYNFTDHLSVWVETSIRSMSSEVKDSPMVDESTRLGFGAGINWRF